MAPAVTIDNESDFAFPSAPTKNAQRTLLVAPPSVSAHPEALNNIFEAHDRNVTDIQMLDRLAMGLVALPSATYDVVLLLTDVDGSRSESSRLLDRNVMGKLVQALKSGGRFKSQDGSFGSTAGAEQTEAILAGLVSDGGEGMAKPAEAAAQTVKLSFGKKKANAAAVPLNDVEAANKAAVPQGEKRKLVAAGAPSGVGFVNGVDFSNDFDMDYDEDDMYIPSKAELMDDDTIDPDTLLTEEDRQKPINIREFLALDMVLRDTNKFHSRSMQAQRQETTSMQGLLMWSEAEDRGGRRREACGG